MPETIHAGTLREEVVLQNPTDGTQTSLRTAEGGEHEDVATVWADVREDAGQTDVVAGRDEPAQRVTLRLRYRSDITKKSRIKWGDRTLQVIGTKALDRMRRWMEVECYVR